jgi:multidrug resistance protein
LTAVLTKIATEFHTTKNITNLSVAFYSLSIAIVPLWWSSLSENYGRRPVYVMSFALFIIFNILSAFSSSIDMFIVMRVLAGGASASVQAVGAGTVADLWEVRERGRAMGIFLLGPMLGPLVSPIIGGAVATKWGWRSTQWVMVIYGVIVLGLMTFFLPETSSRKTSTKNRSSSTDPEKKENKTIPGLLYGGAKIILTPLKVLPLLRFMPIFLTVYYASITFASYYLLNISIQDTFQGAPYSFSTMIVGLMYVPSSLGYILASFLGGRWTDYIMHRQAAAAGRYDDNGNLILRPEDRISENAWFAGLVYPAALLWYGWTAEKHVFWLVPVGILVH